MNTIINVECIDQELIITNSPTIASGGICENFVSFKFCSKWDDFSKTAVFYQNEKNVYYSIIDSENKCEVPYEVTMNEGTLHFGVFGVHGDTRRTSKIDKIRISKGAWNKDMHPSDPSPDIYTQLMSEMNRIDNMLQDLLNGTSETPIGNAKTLEGHEASYFATAKSVTDIENGTTQVGNAKKADSASNSEKLGGKGAREYALQSAVDGIQTMSIGILQTGWNRVAEYNASESQMRGTFANTCEILLQRTSFTYNSHCKLVLDSVTDIQKFYAVDANARTQVYTKVRYVKDPTNLKAYIEVYCSDSDVNTIVTINAPRVSGYPYWQAITPTLTAETVDGVTATTTYDIPANVTPTTTADLANYLPNKDATITGSGGIPLNLKGSNVSYIRFLNSSGTELGLLGLYTDGSPVYYANGKINNILHSGNVGSYALPIGGGTVGSGSSNIPVGIKGKTASMLSYVIADGTLFGTLGFSAVGKLNMSDGSNTYDVHHDGNSAKVVFTTDSTTAPDSTALWAHL